MYVWHESRLTPLRFGLFLFRVFRPFRGSISRLVKRKKTSKRGESITNYDWVNALRIDLPIKLTIIRLDRIGPIVKQRAN